MGRPNGPRQRAARRKVDDWDTQCRPDPQDGEMRSKREFCDKYGGFLEWNAACPMDGPSAYDVEYRTDPDDGMNRCKRDFIDKYGGFDQWDAAVWTAHSQHPSGNIVVDGQQFVRSFVDVPDQSLDEHNSWCENGVEWKTEVSWPWEDTESKKGNSHPWIDWGWGDVAAHGMNGVPPQSFNRLDRRRLQELCPEIADEENGDDIVDVNCDDQPRSLTFPVLDSNDPQLPWPECDWARGILRGIHEVHDILAESSGSKIEKEQTSNSQASLEETSSEDRSAPSKTRSVKELAALFETEDAAPQMPTSRSKLQEMEVLQRMNRW